MAASGAGDWGSVVDWRAGILAERTQSRPRTGWRPAPQPGALPKRPLTFFEVLDAGFRLLRVSPSATVGSAALVCALLALTGAAAAAAAIWVFSGALPALFDNPDALLGFNLVFQVASALGSLLLVGFLQIVSGLCALVAEHAAQSTTRISLRAVWAKLAGRRLRLIGLTAVSVLAHVCVLVVCMLPSALTALASPVAAVAVGLVGALAFLIATVWLTVRFSAAGPILAVEDATIRGSLATAWRRSRRGFIRSAGQIALGWILSSQLVSILLTPAIMVFYILVIVAALLAFSVDSGEGSTAAVVLGVVAGVGFIALVLGATAVLFAYLAGVIAAIALDRRMRDEGYDLVLLRRAEDAEAVAAAASDRLPPASGGGPDAAAGNAAVPEGADVR